MDKQEAIEIIEQNKIKLSRFVETISEANSIKDKIKLVEYVPLEIVVNTIDKIGLKKVVVPKFVAEYIERCKQSGWHLQKALSRLDDDEKVGDWAYDENDDLIPEKVDMVVSAWFNGYEVEQEKLYTVDIPNPVLTDNSDSVTVLMKEDLGVVLTDVVDYIGRKQEPAYHLTESEIKQDFEWAWQFAEEVE